jgi:hypothetical protein
MDAFSYLQNSHVPRSNDVMVVSQIMKKLEKMKVKGKIKKEKENKLSAVLELGKRKQNISVYLYNGMVFLSSVICKEDEFLINDKPLENYYTLLRKNSILPFGYFSTHNGSVTFCERLFWHDYNASFLCELIFEVASQADIYELRHAKQDKY